MSLLWPLTFFFVLTQLFLYTKKLTSEDSILFDVAHSITRGHVTLGKVKGYKDFVESLNKTHNVACIFNMQEVNCSKKWF